MASRRASVIVDPFIEERCKFAKSLRSFRCLTVASYEGSNREYCAKTMVKIFPIMRILSTLKKCTETEKMLFAWKRLEGTRPFQLG